MGDLNQLNFIQEHRVLFSAPFLEIGSKDYGAPCLLHDLFPEEPWLGVYMSPGRGVDVVLDFTHPFEEIDRAVGGIRFRTIFCLSVLEHCEQPFAMANNIVRQLAPDGVIFFSAPFAWKIHGFPSDLWRFTPEGIRKLFPRIEFDLELGHAATSCPDDRIPLKHDLTRISPQSPRWHLRRGKRLRAFDVALMRLAGLLGRFHWLCRYRYVFPPTMINMVGRLKDPARMKEHDKESRTPGCNDQTGGTSDDERSSAR